MAMNNSYVDQFQILQTIENNHSQSILIGTAKKNPKEHVLINIVHDNTYIDIKTKIKKSLKNLVHLENMGQDVVIVTKIQNGLSLEEYLMEERPNMNTRLNMLFQYLKKVNGYNRLNNPLKNSLVNESQIVIEKGRVLLKELIVIDPTSIIIDDFSSVVKKVGKVANKILFEQLDEDNKNYIPPEIIEFMDSLENNQSAYKSLEEVFDTFKEIYLYDEDEKLTARRKKNRKDSKNWLLKILMGVMIAGTIAYGVHVGSEYIKQDKERKQAPVAYFEKIKMKNTYQFINKSTVKGDRNFIQKSIWEVRKNNQVVGRYERRDFTFDGNEVGKYTIALKVQDENNKWSKEYDEQIDFIEKEEVIEVDVEEEKISTDENFDHMAIFYEEDGSIIKDFDVFRNGQYSLRFEKKNKKHSKSIGIEDLKLDQNYSVFMWIMSDSIESSEIQIEGYKNGTRKFEESFLYKPVDKKRWELISFGGDKPQVDEIKIIIANDQSTVWIDDLEVSVYK